MHSLKILSLVLLLQWSQNSDATKTNYEISSDVGKNKDLPISLLYTQHDQDLRSIKEVWNNIKKSVIKAWNFVKDLAETTKEKFNTWIQSVKKRANDLTIKFQDHMKHLKEKINDIIKKTFGNSKVVKMCLDKEIPEIDKTMKQIIKNVSVCITDSMKKPSLQSINLLTVNDSKFLRNLEERFKLCEQDLDNADECMNKVRNDNFNDMQDMETDILKTRAETRNMLDDLLGNLIACSIEGLLEGSSIITLEAVKITKCILKPQSITNLF